MTLWYSFAAELIGSSEPGVVGVSLFWTARSLWFDFYFAAFVAIFAGFWMWFSPHPWAPWSILGSALILFSSYFTVQVTVALNSWRGPFYDMIQAALSKSRAVTQSEFYSGVLTFFSIATVAIVVLVLTSFFVSHYIFRWRTAMNEFYVANWPQLRKIEGASQRVQEDTMRFATITEQLGVNLVRAVLTLIAFLPILVKLSSNVTELPLIGAIPYSLVFAAVIWSVFGTGLLALIGIKLPGIEFFNQRVEAAYRKELVLGEDDPARADPVDLARAVRQHSPELFSAVSELRVLQCRPLRLSAKRRHVSLRSARTDNRRRQDHARAVSTDPRARSRKSEPPSSISSPPGARSST